MDILVAFSGVVKDGEVEYTESGVNIDKEGNHIKEKQLPSKFHEDFNVLVVAEKYQTGFDEPLLHTMFVDNKLSGVKAVQTLSRLNRTCKGKNDTFILDFVNTADEIRDAFLPYYSETTLDEELNVDLIYKTESELRDYNLYNDADIDKFVKINFKKGKQNATDLGKMTSLLKPVVNRYMDLSEDNRYKFLRTIRNFNKWYSYIIQITRMFDKDLHKTYSFTSYLQKLLPRDKVVDVDLEGKLKFYKLEETFKGDITLNPYSEDSEIVNVKNIDAGDKSEYDELLENIIKKINERFEGKFTEGDRVIVETIFNKCIRGNTKLKKQAKSNDSEIFENTIFHKVFDKIAKEAYKDLRCGDAVTEKSGAYNA